MPHHQKKWKWEAGISHYGQKDTSAASSVVLSGTACVKGGVHKGLGHTLKKNGGNVHLSSEASITEML